MNRRLFGAFGVLAVIALSVGSCKSDPLSDLDGNPAALITDFSYLQMPIGSSIAVTASVLDARTTPLEIPITFTACTNDVTVVPDTSYHPVPQTSARAIVTAVTPNPSCVRVAGGGIEDTITVAVLPQAFNGTASTATPQVGQPFSLYASTLLGFDTDSANVDFGGGVVGEVIRRVGDTLTVRVPQPDATPTAPLSVLGIAVKYVPGLTVDLQTATNFTVQPIGDRETPGQVIITPPASGAPDTVFYDGFKSGANGTSTFIDYLYQFTLAAEDTLTFTLEWNTGADLDMVNLRSDFSLIGGFGAATGANPETYTVVFPAGTYHLLIESFDDHDEPAHLFKVTIHNP
jgi:hypothetical protein